MVTLARCRPVAANAADPSARPSRRSTLTWLDARPLAPYEVQIRTAGAWRTVATVSATADMVDKVAFEPVAGDAVRLRILATRFGGQNPKLAELAVSG